ncbi:heavy metal transporter [Streptomyces sp. NPDC005863]|uniref:heavy metal transporter n=1 Tax=unclassified Streptomyces TaxID=2593676 RepID=UPI0033F622EA
MPEPSSPVRRGRLLRHAAAAAAFLAVVGYVALQWVYGAKPAPRCTVVSGNGDGASYTFTAEQAENAATVAVAGTSRGMPERAVTIALATALQESGLRNITHGDRDSLGLFQQRPSQGWGDARHIMDPAYSAGRFYAHLAEVPGYSRLPLTVAAQRVQRSGFPQAYAKHEPDAALLAAALTGRTPATFSCEGRPGTDPGGPARVRAALTRDFGREVRPGTAAGRTVTVPVPARPVADRPPQRGWELAHWAVAYSSALHIEKVAYGGREWRAGEPGGWRRSTADGAGRDAAAGAVRIVTGP